MPRRPSRTAPVLVLHGMAGPRPDAWYSLVADELRGSDREVRIPVLPDSAAPVLADWLAALDTALAGLPDVGFDVVAHSTGALLWLHHAVRDIGLPRPDRVALVAPASGKHIAPPTFQRVPLDTSAVRRAAEGTVLVGGDDDPLCPEGIATAYGVPLKMATTVIEGGGHLNPESGYGPWPAMLDWLRRDKLAFF
ncbi:MAG: RBBP9/YdeN family alpha/beta hydrolase [Jatrophihabitans sp.]